jgi:hypothetical protein
MCRVFITVGTVFKVTGVAEVWISAAMFLTEGKKNLE